MDKKKRISCFRGNVRNIINIERKSLGCRNPLKMQFQGNQFNSCQLTKRENKKLYRFDLHTKEQSAYLQINEIEFQSYNSSYTDQMIERHEITEKLLKYYKRRKFLFQRFDKGIKFDHQSLYSIIPESVSLHLLNRFCRSNVQKVFEPFCGVGGIAVHFCDNFKEYIVNDLSPQRVEWLLHNASSVYGKSLKNLQAYTKDFLEIPPFKTDSIIICPPWGGTNLKPYERQDLDKLIKPKLSTILSHAVKFTNNIMLQLPKTTNIGELLKKIFQCPQIKPIFSIERIFRRQGNYSKNISLQQTSSSLISRHQDQLFVYLGDIEFTQMNINIYQIIYKDLNVHQKGKKEKKKIRREVENNCGKMLKNIYRRCNQKQ